MGSIDLFTPRHDEDRTAPASGVLTDNEDRQMMLITQAGAVSNVSYASLTDVFADQLREALDDLTDVSATNPQRSVVDAALKIRPTIDSAI